MKTPRILYFHKGCVTTKEAHAHAQRLGCKVAFRNANAIASDMKPEPCDGVCGEVPELYKSFPDGDEVSKLYKASFEMEVSEKVSEVAKIEKPKAGGHWKEET